jgi:hypothetical protein
MAQEDTRGAALINQFLEAYQRTPAFTARLEVLTRFKEQESHMALRMHYARPSNIALTVLDAKEFPAANGTTLTWLGERKARVSTQFYGVPLGITLPITDSRICNLRGYSIEDVSLAYEVPILQDPATKLRYLGSATFGGHAAEGIEARSPRLLRGIERERIWLDSRTRFPLLREMYEAGRVVYRMAMMDYEFNPQIPASMFARF